MRLAAVLMCSEKLLVGLKTSQIQDMMCYRGIMVKQNNSNLWSLRCNRKIRNTHLQQKAVQKQRVCALTECVMLPSTYETKYTMPGEIYWGEGGVDIQRLLLSEDGGERAETMKALAL